jgi:hypothetical protein
MRAASVACLFAGSLAAPCAVEQVFINYAESPSQMRVSWATACAASAAVSYGPSPTSLSSHTTGPAPARYTAPFYTSPYIYHVTLSGLTPGSLYYYQVGDATSGSAIYNFTAHPGVGPSIAHTFAVVGDPGQTNNSASTFQHVLSSTSDSVMIVGDLR